MCACGHLSVSLFARVSACLSACVSVSSCVCVRVCMCESVSVFVFICVLCLSLGGYASSTYRSVRDRAEQHIKSQKKFKSGSMTNHDLKDLKELAVLGLGGFGRVSLVQHTSSKDIFALKAMLKSTIVEQDASKNIMNEKEVMALCGAHPFIIRLFQTFKDSKRLYFLLEFVEGGELLSRIYRGRNNGLSNATARFYR